MAKADRFGKELTKRRSEKMNLVVTDSKPRVNPPVPASALLAELARVLKKPGVNRSRIFDGTVGKRVFAYSIYPKDPTKVVREDASGQKTIGRLVRGRFQSVSAKNTE